MSTSDPIFSRILEERTPARATKVRQDLIRRIQSLTGRRLVTYIAALHHPTPNIMPQDIPIFEDLMRVPDHVKKGDLLINSPGGDLNTAEKMLMMCRSRFTEEFNVIVPNYAKSAAALIALGSDKVYMGYLAELGPIDPQIAIPLPTGVTLVPARAYIEGLEDIRSRIKRGDKPELYFPMLAQVRPEMIRFCQDAMDFAEECARKWLRQGTLKTKPDRVEEVARELVRGTKYRSHGQVINYAEAKEVLGLNVELLDPHSELWGLVWELYLRSIAFLQESRTGAKLFESDSSSVTLGVEVAPGPPTPPRGPPQQGPPT